MGTRIDARLRALQRIQGEFGPPLAERRLALIAALARARLVRARDVLALHEALLFARAYPDDERVLRDAERALQRFSRRADLRRFGDELADSGIAGTEIRYAFFAPTAIWLVARYGRNVAVDWDELESPERLARNLWLCTLWAESAALDEDDDPRAQVRRLKGPRESDAEFLVRRFDALPAHTYVRERFLEELALPFRVATGPAGPSRTHARAPRTPGIAFDYQTSPLRRGRPNLVREIRRPPRAVRSLSARTGAAYGELVREAMVTRSRDLDAFMHADERDVRLVDCGGGLELAVIGVRPERRLLLEAVYGMLMLQNGVPIGYALVSALLGSAEVAYNVFDTFRGAEAAHVYGRVLATVRALFGADTFSVPPYQLGHENEEGLRSGAWWFYQKLGFRPRDAGTLRAMRRELRRLARRPGRRTGTATLAALAREPLFFALGKRRPDVIGILPLARVAERVSAYIARRFGSQRETASRVCAAEVATALRARGWKSWRSGERTAFERWSPLVRVLPGVERWSREDKSALLAVIRAKGGRSESEFVRHFDRHARLRSALRTLYRGR